MTPLAALVVAAVQSASPALQPPEATLTLDASAPYVDAAVAGVPMRLRVAFDASGYVTLGAAAAERARLTGPGRPGPAGEVIVQVGRAQTRLPYWRATVQTGGVARPMRVALSNAAASDHADGVISPAALPQDIVRMRFRAERPGDRATLLPAMAAELDGIRASALAGKEGVMLAFDPARATTIATAAAGAVLARAGDGLLTPDPPERVPVAYGVARPVRTVALARTVLVAGRMLTRFHIRLFDWAGEAELPPEAETDDAIVVQRYMTPQRGVALATLGQDLLGDCASIAWRREPAAVELVCPPALQSR